jgi:carbamoyltransferase
MIVLGISCYYHDASAALIRDGVVLAAAQEERFDRDRYSPVFPIQAINYCLREAGITIYDVDELAFYEKMYLKFERTVMGHVAGWPHTLSNFLSTMPLWLKDRLAVAFTVEEELRFKKPIKHVKHHLSHAASCFYPSPFDEAAILTVDGVGEYACATWGWGRGTEIRIEQELHYPHSLGLLYSIFTAFLGFRVFSGEGKVMALAELGEDRYAQQLAELVQLATDGSFRLNTRYLSFNRGERMHNAAFEALFGQARVENGPLEQRHFDLACSLQRMTERVILAMARHVKAKTGMRHLCLAGGVFLNVTANSRIRDEGLFDDIFIQPGAGDAGAALGAASYVYHAVGGHPRSWVMRSAALGPAFDDRAIEVLLRNKRAPYRKLDRDALLDETARLIQEGRIVGWFQGRMEFGPRALGNRSILANPIDPGMKDHLNARVKHRESFRPFGASVQAEHVAEWFEPGQPSPFMLQVFRVRDDKLGQIPAVTHVNQTCRIQSVDREVDGIYWELIERFRQRTGVPMVLNTSFNDQEPIVCTPADAWACFDGTRMDALVMGSFLVEKGPQGT